MKIAILTSGILPVPAVQGGAVENLIDFYLEYNDCHRLHDITVYSVGHPGVSNHPALKSKANHYRYIDTTSLKAKVLRKLRQWCKPRGDYYNNFIEYYLDRALRDIRRQHYDLIILENRPGYALKLQSTSSRLVLHLHNDLLNSTTRSNVAVFNSLNRILTVSDYIKGRVSTIAPDSNKSSKILTIHNGIDLSRFSQQAVSAVNRSELGFTADDFVLVFSGRINRDKGISELIDALLLLGELNDLKLLVIGSTFFGNASSDDNFTLQLKQKAQPIERRLVFTGFVDYSLMPSYLQLADVAVVPSVWDDPFPTTVLEAQAMGLPLIVSNRGGIPEEIGHDNALVVETGDGYAQRLADAISHLYHYRDELAAMGESSKKRSMYFNKERFAADFFNALTAI